MKKIISNDEIDLFEIILSLWENKFKIFIITTAFITTGLLYFYSLNKSFTASTNIKPISTFENRNYEIYNAYAREGVLNPTEKGVLDPTEEGVLNPTEKGVLNPTEKRVLYLNSQSLFNLFINQIQVDEIIAKGIIKSKLINKDNFKSEEIYQEEVKRIAISIIDNMSSPSEDKENKKKNQAYWQYNYNIIDKLKWRNFLEYVEENANEKIRESLISQFNTNLEILSNNAKYKIEDIDQEIANELENYENSISSRLVFLNEQAEIARTLNIAKNTLEIENFQPTIITNIKSESSYYLKGYQMIEKEISLINSRTNKEAFITNLAKLKQDRRLILQDKKIDRLKFVFSKTPIYDENEFIAGKIDFLATTYKPNNQSLGRILSISLIIGLLISVMYVFVLNVITSRK